MPSKRKEDRLKKIEKSNDSENYGSIRMTTNVAPVVYKESLQSMEFLGIKNESTYVAMAVKMMNSKTLKSMSSE